MALFAGQGDHLGVAWALNHLGDTAADSGNYAEARVFYMQALEIFRRRENPWGYWTQPDGPRLRLRPNPNPPRNLSVILPIRPSAPQVRIVRRRLQRSVDIGRPRADRVFGGSGCAGVVRENAADERFARGADQEWVVREGSDELIEFSDQFEVLLLTLSETDSRIDHD